MKKIQKAIALVITAVMLFSLSACTQKQVEVKSESNKQSVYSQPVIEYPSSQDELSSHEESSSLSSIVSNIESSQQTSSQSSSKPASSKPASSKPASSKPASSKPASSKPASSKPASSTPSSSTNQGNNVSHAQMKAVWIAFLEFDQFKGSSESAFTAKINQYFETVVAKGLNTVIVQVRPHGDSMFDSKYYPWSRHASGTVGQALSYDPLEIMVAQAHQRGLEIHAWINPYRTMTDAEMALVGDNFLTKQWYNSADRSTYMVKLADGRWWLKPGNQEVQNLIVDGAKEIVTNYKVDGIHIDDYFYGASVATYGDSSSQAKANTTAMVKGLYDGIKSIKPSVRFGVSPAGGFRATSNLPESDIKYLSTDLALWCSKPGYIDYVMPQVYWGYYHSVQPFIMTLNKWENFVTEDSVALYIGLGPYMNSDDVVRQMMADSLASSRASGYALFRYDHILGL